MHMLNWSHNDPSWLCNSLPSWMGVLGLQHAIVRSRSSHDINSNSKDLRYLWSWEIEATMAHDHYGIHLVITIMGVMGLLYVVMRSRGHGAKSNSNSMEFRSLCSWDWSHNGRWWLWHSLCQLFIPWSFDMHDEIKGHGFKSNSNSMNLDMSLWAVRVKPQWPWLFCAMCVVIGICHASTCHEEGAWGFVMFDGWVDLEGFIHYTKVRKDILWSQTDFLGSKKISHENMNLQPFELGILVWKMQTWELQILELRDMKTWSWNLWN